MRRDAQPLVLARRHDWRRPDAVLAPEIARQRPRVEPVHAEKSDSARLLRILAVQDFDAGQIAQPARPPLPQVAKSFRLALHSNAFVEIKSLGDGVSLGSRMSADLLEFPDIFAQGMVGRH